jgi:DNA-binding CsgD family transcriptional regulator
MRAFENYLTIHWLFIVAELLLLTYQAFRFMGRDEERRNWLALAFLLLLIGYNFTLGWRHNLPVNVAFNLVGIMIVVVTMLINFFRPRRKEATVVDLYERGPDEVFVANCRKYGLSLREMQIAELVRKGYKNKRMADELFISEKTVDTHLRNIYEKVGVRTKVELNNELNR